MIQVAIAATSIAVLFVGLGSLIHFGYPKSPLPNAKHLNRTEQAILSACADSFFPSGGPIPVSGTDAGLVAYMDNYMGRMPSLQRTLVRALLRLIEFGPWVFGPRRARFTRLDQANRLGALDDMRTSEIYFRRVAFLSMRTMLTMGYLANADVARSMGMYAATTPFSMNAVPA